MALQYEYTALGLDECLERLGSHESDELAVQITAYVDNVVSVHDLMEEAETKQEFMDQAADLEEELARVSERLQEQEEAAMSQQVEQIVSQGLLASKYALNHRHDTRNIVLCFLCLLLEGWCL